MQLTVASSSETLTEDNLGKANYTDTSFTTITLHVHNSTLVITGITLLCTALSILLRYSIIIMIYKINVEPITDFDHELKS